LCFLFIFFLGLFSANAQGTLEEYQKAIEVELLFADKEYNAPRAFH
jgi:hypothetical protein